MGGTETIAQKRPDADCTHLILNHQLLFTLIPLGFKLQSNPSHSSRICIYSNDYFLRLPASISTGEQSSGGGSAGDRWRAFVRVRAEGRVRGRLALRRLLPRPHSLAAVALSQMCHSALLPRGLPIERRTSPPLRMRPRARAAPTRTQFEFEHLWNLNREHEYCTVQWLCTN